MKPKCKWTREDVRYWLLSERVDQRSADILYKGKITGAYIKHFDTMFLHSLGIKEDEILKILKVYNKLMNDGITVNIKSKAKKSKISSNKFLHLATKTVTTTASDSNNTAQMICRDSVSNLSNTTVIVDQRATQVSELSVDVAHDSGTKFIVALCSPAIMTHLDCIPRDFDHPEDNVVYKLNSIIPPETGVDDMIRPCREFKALSIEKTSTNDEILRGVAYFSEKVLYFAAGCINARSNGTIYFGVRDKLSKKGDICYRHGQVTGLHVKEKDLFISKLTESIKNCFDQALVTTVGNCIRPIRFIRVIGERPHMVTENTFVLEVDVVPSSEHTGKGVFPIIKYPKISDNKKWRYEEIPEKILIRRGDTTTAISCVHILRDLDSLYESRVRAEKGNLHKLATKMQEYIPEVEKRRIRILLTKNKESIDNSIGYIVVTNRCEPENLESLRFLSNIKIMCVFDFDPDSNVSGLCYNYRKDSTKLHSLNDYYAQKDAQDLKQFVEHFKQTSWVFCNGRTDIPNSKIVESEQTWIQMEWDKISKAIQLLCDYPLPFERTSILFFIHSPVMILPLQIFLIEFYKKLKGFEHIVCIAEDKVLFEKLVSSPYFDCETIIHRSIVGLKLSILSSMLGTILPDPNFQKRLATLNGTCIIKSKDEDKMPSLEIIKANELDDTDKSELDEVGTVERSFYRGDPITWKHLWLGENRHCETIIERDTFNDIDNILRDIANERKETVMQITIYHQPGSGGSTVTRQILWKYRKKFRCAVIKSLYSSTEVSDHAMNFHKFGESNHFNCVPVLLLLDLHEEYSENEFLSTLKRKLENLCLGNRLSFVIFVCKQDMNPTAKVLRVIPDLAFDVVHKLREREGQLFSDRVKYFEEEYNVNLSSHNKTSRRFETSMLTLILMAKEFKKKYVEDIVRNVLKGIDTGSTETRLIKYVALLNSFGRNSMLSQSHCESFLSFKSDHMLEEHHKTESNFPEFDRFKDSLGEQANFLLKFVTDSTNLDYVQIVHVKVAPEVLSQLAGSDPYSTIALNLLKENKLIQHKHLLKEFKDMMIHFFLHREEDQQGRRFPFSPFIQYICENESKDIAVEIASRAYSYLGPKQALIAQMIARLYIPMRKFESSIEWIEIAKSDVSKPNSGILHTEGKIYQEWFYAELQKLDQDVIKPNEAYHLVELALTAINSFMESHDAATCNDKSNNYTYVGHVDTSCQLLKLLARLSVFYNNDEPSCRCNLVKYLSNSFIPVELDTEDSWKGFHKQLKNLRKIIEYNLVQVSNEVCCFQTSRDIEEDTETIEHNENTIDQHSGFKKWLHIRSKEYAKYLYCDIKEHESNNDFKVTNQILIYKLGGGTPSTILSLLTEENNIIKLEELLDLYGNDAAITLGDQTNYIFLHLALSCTKSDKYCTLQDLQKCCFSCHRHETYSQGYYFLRMMLYWPNERSCYTRGNPETQYKIVDEAIRHLQIRFASLRSDRKPNIYTAFFLGNGSGFNDDMFVHKSRLQKLLGSRSTDERRLMWRSGEVWQNLKVQRILQRVNGWAYGGDIFVEGHSEKFQIKVHPINMPGWLHNSDKHLSFYLGFSFNGPVAFDVQSQ